MYSQQVEVVVTTVQACAVDRGVPYLDRRGGGAWSRDGGVQDGTGRGFLASQQGGAAPARVGGTGWTLLFGT